MQARVAGRRRRDGPLVPAVEGVLGGEAAPLEGAARELPVDGVPGGDQRAPRGAGGRGWSGRRGSQWPPPVGAERPDHRAARGREAGGGVGPLREDGRVVEPWRAPAGSRREGACGCSRAAAWPRPPAARSAAVPTLASWRTASAPVAGSIPTGRRPGRRQSVGPVRQRQRALARAEEAVAAPRGGEQRRMVEDLSPVVGEEEARRHGSRRVYSTGSPVRPGGVPRRQPIADGCAARCRTRPDRRRGTRYLC